MEVLLILALLLAVVIRGFALLLARSSAEAKPIVSTGGECQSHPVLPCRLFAKRN